MELPTSMASSDLSCYSLPPSSSNADLNHSFRLFLDLITPAEFSKLLRARVKHLLSAWPPQSQSTQNLSTSSSSFRHEHLALPTFESIEAFAAFFRSQDSPPPSPTDGSVTTPLSTLHHKLLALQTLLTFLSGRELKDIVRARLAEGGKDRSLQGLMDIMRDPGEGEIEASLGGRDIQTSTAGNDDIMNNDKPNSGKVEASTRSLDATVSPASQPKIPVQSLVDTKASADIEGQRPKKRQKIYPSGTSEGQSMYPPSPSYGSQFQVSSQPVLSQQYGQTTHVLDSMGSTASISNIPNKSPDSQTAEQSLGPSNDQTAPQSASSVLRSDGASLKPMFARSSEVPDRKEVMGSRHYAEVSTKFSYQLAMFPTAGHHISKTGFKEEAGVSNVDLQEMQELGSSTPNVPSPLRSDTGKIVSAVLPPTPEQAVLSPALNTAAGKEQQQLPLVEGKLAAKEDERDPPEAAPENFQDSDDDKLSGKPFKVTRNLWGKDPARFLGEPACGGAVGPTPRFLASDHLPTLPLAESSTPRSRSFRRSFSDRASPPGPMLRTAVDWASGISPTADRGVEDALAYDDTGIFNTESDNATITSRMFAPDSFGRSTSNGWDDSGDTLTSVTETSTAEANVGGRAAQRQKLFIRLPARPKARLTDSGVATDCSITPPCASGRASPVPEHGAKSSFKTSTHGETPVVETPSLEKDAAQVSMSASDLCGSASVNGSSPKTTPPARHTPSIAAPHARYPMQYPATSRPQSGRPQSGSPHTVPPGSYALPQSAYPGQPPYPGPWFGAMFYVPFRGHPHPHSTMPHAPKMPPGPSRQPSDAASSGRTGTEEQVSGPSAPPPTPSTSAQPPAARKKVVRRADPGPSENTSPPPPPVLDPDMTYTDDIGVKETATVKRRCFNCRGIQAPSWRKSKLTFGKILCNKCGIYESTHMMARPLKTRPRRSQVGEGQSSAQKKRKVIKMPPATP